MMRILEKTAPAARSPEAGRESPVPVSPPQQPPRGGPASDTPTGPASARPPIPSFPGAPPVSTEQPRWRRLGQLVVWLRAYGLLIGVTFGLAAGLLARLLGMATLSEAAWLATLLGGGAPFLWESGYKLLHRRLAADFVASLAMIVALLQREYLAGAVIALMLATGQALEAYGKRHASDALAALLARAPRRAHRRSRQEGGSIQEGGPIEEILVEDVVPGDLLLVLPGELVPVDGIVVGGESTVDESVLTGEPLPVAKQPGSEVRSGTINVDGALEVRATQRSTDSEYAQIVRLMEAAQQDRPAIQRTADQVAIWFTPFTLAAATLVYLLTRDVERVLAVLVVATPCPLILATPVAIISGINRAARHGIIIKGGAALEQLHRVRAAVFDKTGTLTFGQPVVQRVVSLLPEIDEVALLRLAAAVEQRSSHLLARAIVEAAEASAAAAGTKLALPDVRAFQELPGRGAEGWVAGHRIAVGSFRHVTGQAAAGESPQSIEPRCAALIAEAARRSELVVAVGIDGRCAGVLFFADRVRPGLRAFVQRLHDLGVREVIMLTGDHEATARAVAMQAGITHVQAGLLPAGKVAAVQAWRKQIPDLMMVGDGINDAPALASAAVGVALGARGAAISAAAADVVLLVDDVTRVADALEISHRTMRIIFECIFVGLGLSAAAMVAAGLGLIPPVAGAAIQEAIDAAVILNALRAR